MSKLYDIKDISKDKNKIDPIIKDLQKRLDDYKELWLVMPEDKRKEFLAAGKLPFIKMAIEFCEYLNENFPGLMESIYVN